MNPHISIIVPSYKSQCHIFTALDSFLAQKTRYPYEIIVVDSTPSDLHSDIVKTYPDIKVIHSKMQLFPGEARNIGIKAAKGEIIIFLDSDITISSNLIDKIVEDMNKGYDVISGSIDVANPVNLVGWAQYLFEFNEYINESPKGFRRTLATYCLGIRKKILDQHGFFHVEKLWAEDMHFSSKLIKNNIKLYFNPEIKIKHFNKNNFKDILRTQFYLGRGGMLVRRQYKLPGNYIVDYPFLLPLAGFYKYASIFVRLLKYSKKKNLMYIFLTPLILAILAAYMSGMYRGRLENNVVEDS